MKSSLTTVLGLCTAAALLTACSGMGRTSMGNTSGTSGTSATGSSMSSGSMSGGQLLGFHVGGPDEQVLGQPRQLG